MKKEHSVSLRPVTTTDELKELRSIVKEIQREVRDLNELAAVQQEVIDVHGEKIKSIRSALSIL